jgi:hypothetical protein
MSDAAYEFDAHPILRPASHGIVKDSALSQAREN